MSNEEFDIRRKIERLEDNLLRSIDFQEQLRMYGILNTYRRKLQMISQRNK